MRADLVIAALKAASISQAELARRIGVNPSYLARVLNGHRSGYTLTPKIAQALNVDPEWLTTGAHALAPVWARGASWYAENPPTGYTYGASLLADDPISPSKAAEATTPRRPVPSDPKAELQTILAQIEALATQARTIAAQINLKSP